MGEGGRGFGEGSESVGRGWERVGEGWERVGEGRERVGEGSERVGEGGRGLGEGGRGLGEGWERVGRGLEGASTRWGLITNDMQDCQEVVAWGQRQRGMQCSAPPCPPPPQTPTHASSKQSTNPDLWTWGGWVETIERHFVPPWSIPCAAGVCTAVRGVPPHAPPCVSLRCPRTTLKTSPPRP